jgi:hypothetical protein
MLWSRLKRHGTIGPVDSTTKGSRHFRISSAQYGHTIAKKISETEIDVAMTLRDLEALIPNFIVPSDIKSVLVAL